MSEKRGTLGMLSREFLFVQRREIAARLRIISRTRYQLSNQQSQEAADLLRAFNSAVERKIVFNKMIGTFKPKLEIMGIWDETSEKIWRLLNPLLEEFKEMLAEKVRDDPIWENWLSQVKGVDYLLAGEVIGGFENALRPNENLGQHFQSVSQMWAFSGLDVKNGKAPRLIPGKKASFNTELRSILVGRLGKSLILAGGEYYEYYKEQKQRLVARYNREGIKIIPASKLPTKKGKRYEPEGVIARGHLDYQARRKMIKLFVAHLWEVARTIEGLPAGSIHVFETLHHPKEDYIPPIRDKARDLARPIE